MIVVLKISSNIYDPKVTKFFTYGDHTVTRGSQIKKIYQPFCHSSIRHNLFSIRIYKICNLLPHDVIEGSGLDIFKNRLDKHWCKQASVLIMIVMHLRSYAQTFKDLVYQANIRPFDQYSS